LNIELVVKNAHAGYQDLLGLPSQSVVVRGSPFPCFLEILTQLVVLVLLMLLGLVIYIIKRRSSHDDEEYNVEAAQMEGPPTIIATEYNPTSGPSGIYSGGPNGHGTGKDKFPEREMSYPTQPLPAYQSDRLPTYTAPVSQTVFSDRPYPFAYDSVSYDSVSGAEL
jgi:hypothetical protein